MLLKTDPRESLDVICQPFVQDILRHMGLELAFPYEKHNRMDQIMADSQIFGETFCMAVVLTKGALKMVFLPEY